jgi:hypothetical protein
MSDKEEHELRCGESFSRSAPKPQRPEQAKAIKLSMIHLASESVEDVLLSPGWRYGIVKVTNNTMTARKGVWSWTVHEVSTQSKTRLKHPFEMYNIACR